MNIFTRIFILILCSACVLRGNGVNRNIVQVRLKREPPVYRPVTVYRPTYGSFRPVYGVPKLNYGPPKLIYGPTKPIYGPPKPIYGPPKSYYAPSKPIYGPPGLIYGSAAKPIYDFWVPNYTPHSAISSINEPSPLAYEVSAHPSTSYSSKPSQNYRVPPPSEIPSSYPSDNYGNPVQTYKLPFHAHPTYNAHSSSGDTYSMPQSIYVGYGPSSQAQLISPLGFDYEQPARPHSGYEVPITQAPQALQYDTSSASYGTPGAVTSYGTPVGNYEEKNLQKRINSPYLQEPFTSFEEDAYGSSSNVARVVEESITTSPANRTSKRKIDFVMSGSEKKASNHNYDGPTVNDKFETQKVKKSIYSAKKILVKKIPPYSVEEGEYFKRP